MHIRWIITINTQLHTRINQLPDLREQRLRRLPPMIRMRTQRQSNLSLNKRRHEIRFIQRIQPMVDALSADIENRFANMRRCILLIYITVQRDM
jgi:hypothetical protein